jgi:hypothetical protein
MNERIRGLLQRLRFDNRLPSEDVAKGVVSERPEPSDVAEIRAHQRLHGAKPKKAALRGWWGIEFVSLKTRGPVALLG